MSNKDRKSFTDEIRELKRIYATWADADDVQQRYTARISLLYARKMEQHLRDATVQR